MVQRVQADFINYRKRVEEEQKRASQQGKEDIILKLLPLLDNFHLCLQHKEHHEEFVKGVEMIKELFDELLAKEGVKEIACVGKSFDPYTHEALLAEETDTQPGIIIEEFQKGYKLQERVLRQSKVKISRKS